VTIGDRLADSSGDGLCRRFVARCKHHQRRYDNPKTVFLRPNGHTTSFLIALAQPNYHSGRRNLVLLDEQRPVSTARGSRRPKVAEVPGEDERLPSLSHRHHHGVAQIEPRSLVLLEELKSTTMLRVRRAVEDMRAIEQCV
jgi:hypothetical protein